jgi:hypothetical protein
MRQGPKAGNKAKNGNMVFSGGEGEDVSGEGGRDEEGGGHPQGAGHRQVGWLGLCRLRYPIVLRKNL